MPPCRKPAVTSRHHWPAAMAGPNLAPNASSVRGSMLEKRAPVAGPHAVQRAHQVEPEVGQQNDDGVESRVGDQPAQHVRRAAPVDCARAHPLIAVRADFVFHW